MNTSPATPTSPYVFPEAIKQLHHVYSPEIPDFLEPFILAPEMQRLGGVTQTCGVALTRSFDYKFILTRLDHSVGVALIIRHFTQDKAQTLAGLFHDISHTAFSHVGDFLRWDHENQESSEVYHDQILMNSAVITAELQKIWIPMDAVNDYTLYPIADNPWPQLAADRLEYNFCEVVSRTGDVTIVRGIYNDITVLTNEHGQPELWFQNIEMATAFAYMALENDQQFFGWYESKLTMSFLTMILKEACDKHIFTLDDLYTLHDEQVFELIYASQDRSLIAKLDYFKRIRYYKVRQKQPDTKEFTVDTKIKKRFIDPLVQTTQGVVRLRQIDTLFAEKVRYHREKPVERITCEWMME